MSPLNIQLRMSRTVIFDTHITGHNLEYLHHIYSEAINRTDETFIFAIPEAFKDVRHKLSWREASNISFHYITHDELRPTICGFWRRPLINCCILRRIVKQYNADSVILIVLAQILPFVFLLPRRVSISGILYYIYLYKWKSLGIYSRFVEVLNYLCIKYTSNVKRVFLLNDYVAVRYFNKKYKTSKFCYLLDPVFNKVSPDLSISRKSLGIPERSRVYFHFGSMSYRKGTLDVLKCIEYLDPINTYIFAGVVAPDIKEEFYNRVQKLNERYHILLFDEFCSFEKIASFCQLSNFLFLPYKEVYQSSGVIGYASLYNVPVISTKNGMLGKLVRRYKLGWSFDFSNIKAVCKEISSIECKSKPIPVDYVKTHSVSEFSKVLLCQYND